METIAESYRFLRPNSKSVLTASEVPDGLRRHRRATPFACRFSRLWSSSDGLDPDSCGGSCFENHHVSSLWHSIRIGPRRARVGALAVLPIAGVAINQALHGEGDHLGPRIAASRRLHAVG